MTQVAVPLRLRPKPVRFSSRKNFAWSFTLGRNLAQNLKPLSFIMSSKKPAAKTPAKSPAKSTAKTPAKTPAKGAAAKGGAAKGAGAAKAPEPAKLTFLPENEFGLKELPKVISDAEGKIKASGRWATIVDADSRIAMFMRHRDCNMLSALDSNDMQPEKIRMGLLGAIRYGKPLVIDLDTNGDISMLEDKFNAVMDDLWKNLLNKKIIEDDMFMKLVKDGDGEDYTASSLFGVGEGFCFVVITAQDKLADETKGRTIVFRVV